MSPAREAEVRASFAAQGLMCGIGAEIAELGPGRCVVVLRWSEAVAQQHGFFHGGIVGAVADNAGGFAAMTLLPAGSDVLTLEYKVNFLRPAAGERLVAEGTVLRAGRTVAVSRADVFVERDGRRVPCAAMQQTLVPAQP